MVNKKAAKWAADIAVIAASALMYSVGVICFSEPNNIAPGGVTGVAIIISSVTGIPVGTLYSLINIPIVIVGFFLLNRRTMLKTLIAVVFITIISNVALVNAPVYSAQNGGGIMAAIFGGVLIGAGLGFTYTREATTGGMDIVNKIINRYFPHMRIGEIIFITDAAVIALGYAVYRDMDAVLYAVISVFVQTRIIDSLVYGGMESKFLMIFTEHADELANRLTAQHRGVTLIDAKGAYSGQPRRIVCTAVKKSEYIRVKRLVREVDSRAFVITTGADEVLGEGFQQLL